MRGLQRSDKCHQSPMLHGICSRQNLRDTRLRHAEPRGEFGLRSTPHCFGEFTDLTSSYRVVIVAATFGRSQMAQQYKSFIDYK